MPRRSIPEEKDFSPAPVMTSTSRSLSRLKALTASARPTAMSRLEQFVPGGILQGEELDTALRVDVDARHRDAFRELE
jgi:hypothetical protein